MRRLHASIGALVLTVSADAAAQDEHEAEMKSMGGVMHDDPNGISVKPGETKEMTYTFQTAGAFLAGCHMTGHYGAGVKASITVTP
jgi:uncharacterized cupredoxin-like copper-binding protein